MHEVEDWKWNEEGEQLSVEIPFLLWQLLRNSDSLYGVSAIKTL